MNKEIIEGLNILYKYLKANTNNIKIDTEEIIVKLSIKKVSDEDYQQLQLLQWGYVKKNTTLYRESHFFYLLD